MLTEIDNMAIVILGNVFPTYLIELVYPFNTLSPVIRPKTFIPLFPL